MTFQIFGTDHLGVPSGGRHRAPDHDFVPLGKGNTHDGCRYIINVDHPAEMYCGLPESAHLSWSAFLDKLGVTLLPWQRKALDDLEFVVSGVNPSRDVVACMPPQHPQVGPVPTTDAWFPVSAQLLREARDDPDNAAMRDHMRDHSNRLIRQSLEGAEDVG